MAAAADHAGEFVNSTWLKVLAYFVACVIGGLNVWLLMQFFKGVMS
ncbi:MAG TPA: hypothetical protein VJZ25_09300 [Gemmatimonadaceae bacterium]|nr:hypothetical protein [Gemmatimonadaceae bacterium]